MAGVDMTKQELRKFIQDTLKDELKSIDKKTLSKDQTKDMIRGTIVGLFKFLWQKSSIYVNQI